MTKIITSLLLGVAFFFNGNGTFAQKLDFEKTSPIFFGLNAGATWHHTDVKTRFNFGGGFVFGGTLNRDYGNIFTYDLKFRYLGGNWVGQNTDTTGFSDYDNVTLSSTPTDYKGTYGYSLNNFKTQSHEFNLELGVHLNRLTERTGIDPYIFGGIGATVFQTKGNLLDNNGFMYDYSTLSGGNSLDGHYNIDAVKSFMDGSYESDLDGSQIFDNLELMGHLGVGIGYYFTPNFSVGFEHKTTFTGGDRFDGMFANHGILKKDIYHYTSLYLKVYFNRIGWNRNNETVVTPTPPNTTPSNPNVYDCPSPNIVISTQNNATTREAIYQLSGVIQNAGRSDVNVTLNGVQTTNFSLNSNNAFNANFNLQPGQNTIIVIASNQCGNDTETIYVNYTPCDQPTVYFTDPRSTTVSTTEAIYPVKATIRNLGNGSLQYLVNGQQINNYNYNNSTGIFASNATLRNGSNTVQIIVTNDCGRSEQTVNIEYNKQCPAPVIKLQTPQNSTVSQPYFQVVGAIHNATREAITMTLNGIQTGNFSSSVNNTFKSDFNLQPGLNTIVINAYNECGNASETIHVNYTPACDAPQVVFTNPRTANISTINPTYSIQAKVTNLDNGLIQLYVNGQQSTNFNYNNATGMLTSNIQLQTGSNTIQIVVSNQCGTSSQTVYIEYNKQCPTPIITITAPTTTHGTSNRVELVAQIENISNANQVDVYVNGQEQSIGTYNASTKTYRQIISLTQKQNTITIRATNSCGTSEQTISYEYGQPCIEPTVTLTQPSGSRVTSNTKTYTVQAIITNVTDPQNILFKVNNKTITSFNYSIQNGLFTATIQLENGSNLVELSVSNNCGYASATSTISYTAPCDKPVVTWKNPTTNTTVRAEDFVLEATITGINNINDVVLTVNGVTQSGGTFINSIYRKPIKLRKGNNTIILTASNYCGENTSSLNIHYKDVPVEAGDKPTVVFTNSCGVVVKPGIIVFKGNILGVTETSQIQVKLNNNIQNAIVYSRIDNGFSFTFEIRSGFSQKYVLDVIASNAFGTTIQRCEISTEDPPVVDRDITICHTVNRVKQTLVIKESEWPKYQRLGATLGECKVVVDNDIVICLTQRGRQMTLTIKESQWENYRKMGATRGACPETVDNDIVICLPKGREKVTMTIKESQWEGYKRMGATLGACPDVVDNDIIVCVPQGRTKVTMTIKESQWGEYQRMGATLGECPIVDPDLVICVREGNQLKTITIKESQWAAYQAKGATLGPCPEVVDNDIIICVPQGRTRVTMTVKQSEWATYEAQGATLGACPTGNDNNNNGDDEMTNGTPSSDGMLICVLENGSYVTKTIPVNKWKEYERLGATRGACVQENPRGGVIVKPRPPIVTPGKREGVNNGGRR